MRTLIDNLDIFLLGFGNTLALFGWAVMWSLLGGVLLAAMRVSPIKPMRVFATLYVNLVRNTPLTLLLLAMAIAYPKLELFPIDYFSAAVTALSIYTASFVAETVRSGINTVPSGQIEAARALGLTFRSTMSLVVLPQALRATVPPLMSVMIALLKNTTVAGGFSVVEAGAIRAYLSERSEPAMVVLLWVMAIFIAMVLLLAALQRWLERRLSLAT